MDAIFLGDFLGDAIFLGDLLGEDSFCRITLFLEVGVRGLDRGLSVGLDAMDFLLSLDETDFLLLLRGLRGLSGRQVGRVSFLFLFFRMVARGLFRLGLLYKVVGVLERVGS